MPNAGDAVASVRSKRDCDAVALYAAFALFLAVAYALKFHPEWIVGRLGIGKAAFCWAGLTAVMLVMASGRVVHNARLAWRLLRSDGSVSPGCAETESSRVRSALMESLREDMRDLWAAMLRTRGMGGRVTLPLIVFPLAVLAYGAFLALDWISSSFRWLLP